MALPDDFDEDIRKSMLERFPLPTVPDAVRELLFVVHRLTYDKFSSLSLHDKDFPAKKMNNDQTKRSNRSQKDSPQFGGCQPSIQDPIQQSDKDYRPYFSLSRLASSLTPDNNQPALSTDQWDLHKSILKSQLESELSGQSPLECGIYVPPFRRGLCIFRSL